MDLITRQDDLARALGVSPHLLRRLMEEPGRPAKHLDESNNVMGFDAMEWGDFILNRSRVASVRNKRAVIAKLKLEVPDTLTGEDTEEGSNQARSGPVSPMLERQRKITGDILLLKYLEQLGELVRLKDYLSAEQKRFGTARQKWLVMVDTLPVRMADKPTEEARDIFRNEVEDMLTKLASSFNADDDSSAHAARVEETMKDHEGERVQDPGELDDRAAEIENE